MEPERYTDRAAVALGQAIRHADAAPYDEVGVDDLLIGLLLAGDGVALHVLKVLGIDREPLWRSAGGDTWRPRTGKEPPVTPTNFVRWMADPRPPLSADAQAVLAFAAEEAGVEGHLGTEHLLFGLMRHGVDALADQGLTLEHVVAETGRQLAEFHRGRHTVLEPAAADELIAIPRITLPADIRAFDESISDAQRRKEAAIDAQDFMAAATVRDEEKALVAQRATRVKEWGASLDLLAIMEELEALRDAVDQLRVPRPPAGQQR